MFSKLLTRILVPYDGSIYSKKALTRAIELAHNLDSEILLFNVVNLDYISPPGMLHGLTKSKSKSPIQKWIKSIKKEAEKMLKSCVNRCQSRGITARYYIGQGNVSKEILSFAKKKRVTLIIIGSQGLKGFSKLKMLGSVSRKVSELAHCPVMIVR